MMMHYTDKQKGFLEKICLSSKLPVMPTIAQQILALQAESELYPEKIEKVIASDPVLAGRMLSLSNSALYNRGKEITELKDAITVLGVALTMNAAVGCVLVQSFRSFGGENFDCDAFWRRSVLSGIAAREMSRDLQGCTPGELFVGGLLQDIGILVFSQLAGDKYDRIVAGSRSHLDLSILEQRVFGVDHADVGAALLHSWGLPPLYVDAVRKSHSVVNESCDLAELSDFEYGIAFAGMLAERWIADSISVEYLDEHIQECIDRFGEEGYHQVLSRAIDCVPCANDLFDLQILPEDSAITQTP